MMARAIDADAFRNEINEYIYPIIGNNLISGADVFYRVLHLLEEAPTIEAEPVKHGKWIEKYCSWYCSECGKSGYKGYIPAKPSDFCPNCGARMDGE